MKPILTYQIKSNQSGNGQRYDSGLLHYGFHFLAGAVLILSVFWLFGNSMNVGFLGDDYCFLDSSDSWNNVLKSFVSEWFWHDLDVVGARFYRPLQIFLTYIEQRFLWGENPWGYHFDLLLIHIANSFLVAGLIWLLIGDSHRRPWWIPWLAAFAFALHPRHTESICMINGRTDSLCAFFFLTSIIAYIGAQEIRSRIVNGISVFFFVCALLSKEMAATLPGILVVYDLARRQRDSTGSLRSTYFKEYFLSSKAHWIALLLVFGVLRTWALGGYIFGKASYITIALSPKIYYLAICKLISTLYLPFEPIINQLAPRFMSSPTFYGTTFASVLAISLIVSIWVGSRLWSLVLVFLLFCPQPIVSQLTEFQTTLSDRYLYIPSIAVPLSLAGLLMIGMRIHRLVGLLLALAACVGIIAYIPPNQKYVEEWQIAGKTAETIRQQIEKLDRERPIDERFCFLAMPALYQGKFILDTGYERYFNEKKVKQNIPFRILTPIIHLDLTAPPESVTTKTEWTANRGIRQSVEGGFYRFPIRIAHPQIRLATETTTFPSSKANFTYSTEGEFPVLLLAFDRGAVVPLSAPIDDVLVGQGSNGDGYYQQFDLYKSAFRDQMGIPAGLLKEAQIVPERGFHCSVGDVDGNGTDDIVLSLGPTGDSSVLHPGIVSVLNQSKRSLVGHPFTPFPRSDSRPIANPSGEVRTVVGAFLPGRRTKQIACAQGEGGKEIVRLYEYTGKEAPYGYQIVGQFLSFTAESRAQNEGGGVTLSQADFDRDGIDELVLGQTKSQSCPLIQIVSLNSPGQDGQAAPQNSENIFPAFDDSSLIPGVGVEHAAGDVNGDGIPELLTVAMSCPMDSAQKNPVVHIWKVIAGENKSFHLSLLGKVPISMEERNAPPKSIRIQCGNFDIDPFSELVLGIVEYGETPRNYLKLYDLLFSEDGAFQKAESIMGDKFNSQKLFWPGTPLGWLEVEGVRQ